VDEARFGVPRYTVPEAARYLDVHPETFRRWVDGYSFTPTHRSVPTVGKPIIHSVRGGWRRHLRSGRWWVPPV
jgi:hypothetical protein